MFRVEWEWDLHLNEHPNFRLGWTEQLEDTTIIYQEWGWLSINHSRIITCIPWERRESTPAESVAFLLLLSFDWSSEECAQRPPPLDWVRDGGCWGMWSLENLDCCRGFSTQHGIIEVGRFIVFNIHTPTLSPLHSMPSLGHTPWCPSLLLCKSFSYNLWPKAPGVSVGTVFSVLFM